MRAVLISFAHNEPLTIINPHNGTVSLSVPLSGLHCHNPLCIPIYTMDYVPVEVEAPAGSERNLTSTRLSEYQISLYKTYKSFNSIIRVEIKQMLVL